MKPRTATQRPPLAGFRLDKLELHNWGPFDSTAGRIYSIRPAGRSALLIGKNGSGKSTVVDALLTLLVRPAVRNYNVAAGAKKQERDERTYVRGAYGRSSRLDETGAAEVKYLRPGNAHYSVLLATFRNAAADRVFTIAQVIYLNATGRVEKVYCFAEGERSIADDCSGIASTDRLRQQLEQRGFRATTRYHEYHQWLLQAIGARAKAMDMFNQTVAVKDIASLTDFIRTHMLEGRRWSEQVDSLLDHFTELSQAHQSLLKARRQAELLGPIETHGRMCQQRQDELAGAQRLLEAADAYFSQKTVELVGAALAERRLELEAVRGDKRRATRAAEENQSQRRRLENSLEQSAGQRLQQIPLEIERRETAAEAAHEAARRYQRACEAAELDGPPRDAAGFDALKATLADRLAEVQQQAAEAQRQRDQLLVHRDQLAGHLAGRQAERADLERRPSNVPAGLAEARGSLAEALEMSEAELPFAAELMQVRTDESRWQASIEMVLRSFALSVIVPPDRLSEAVATLGANRLVDRRGRGQRLVCLAAEPVAVDKRKPLHRHAVLKKLEFHRDHPRASWAADYIRSALDYRCCDTVDEMLQTAGLAVTEQRHGKRPHSQSKPIDERVEKDDRPQALDPRRYVLGWDNQSKRDQLAQEIARLESDLERATSELSRAERRSQRLATQSLALAELAEFRDFLAIDYARHNREIHALEEERQSLEASVGDELLRQRLADATRQQEALLEQRDELVARERELENKIADDERRVANAQQQLAQREADGSFGRHAESFEALDAAYAEQPLAADDLVQRSLEFHQRQRAAVAQLQSVAAPLERDTTAAMNRFLREFPEARDDLDARIEYLNGFLELLEHLQAEDLPRHESRFRSRLNEKVTQELGLFHGALQAERSEILSKIDQLNSSLQQVSYRPGTHMRLEAIEVRDREIRDFRKAIAACLDEKTTEGTPAAEQARYERIEKLVTRLRDQRRWRDKVIDVRRWYDFAARELDDHTGDERAYYTDSTGQSGGEKAKLAFTILVAAIAYQYNLDPHDPASERFHFVVVDEMFSKVDDQYAEYALELFEKFGLQLLIVAPLDAKALVTEPYVGSYLHVLKDEETNRSEVLGITAGEFEETMMLGGTRDGNGEALNGAGAKPQAASPR